MEILDSLIRHRQKERASFHMPGHKNGAAFSGTRFENRWLGLDVTEVEGTDCLSKPSGAILKSQETAARLYGAARAFYLVNGASGGILSMFYAFFREGDSVLVDRSCHRSVFHALAICGLRPIYLAPEVDSVRGVPKGITADAVRRMLAKYPQAAGVFLTSPNYYGFCSETKAIAQAAHEKGIPLLVDEAHGAHFPFDSRFPHGAIEQGADAACVSLHKSLPCPNQTALLLLRTDERADEVQEEVNTFQTTSPSYVFLVYIEAALEYAVRFGKEKTDRLLSWMKPFARFQTDDPFKLLMSFDRQGLSGYEADRILREEYGIYAELCDRKNVLLMASWGNREEDFTLLKKAVECLESAPAMAQPHPQPLFSAFSEGRPAMEPRTVRGKKAQWAELSACVGKICAGAVTLFPPCVPILLPGEEITQELVCELGLLRDKEIKVSGMEHGKIRVLLQ